MPILNSSVRAASSRRFKGSHWLLASLLLSTASVTYAQVPEDAASEDDDTIVVTARNRDENANDVPIPLNVLSSATLADQHVFTVAELAERVPGLTATTPNARRSGISLRGVGKTSGNDNMEAAVGVIVDDVFLGHVGMTYQDFTDLQQVEILHGPQGTLLGKNTSIGAIKYTSKAPTFTPEGTAEVEGGLNRPAIKARASYSGPLIGDILAFRASAFVDKQDGDFWNINPAVGGRWHEKNRWGGRLQFLLKAADNFSVRANLDYANVKENSNTKPFIVDPTTLLDGSVRSTTYTTRLARAYFGGYTPTTGSWNKLDLGQALPLVTRNYGGSIVVDWQPGGIEITSITAVRKFHFDARNDSEQTHFDVSTSGTLVDSTQYSQELRFNGKLGGTLDYQAGVYLFRIDTQTTSRTGYGVDAGAFYATNAQYSALSSAAKLPFLQASLANIRSWNFQHPISDSQAAFAQLNWKPTDKFTLTTGLRFTHEHKTSLNWKQTTKTDGSALVPTGDATADAIRSAQLKSDFTTQYGTTIDHGAIAWLVNPSYKVDENLLLYASASAGEKSGAVSFSSTGKPANVAPERTLDFELGFKSQFFDGRLTLNANLYYTRVHNYQAVTSIVDANSATGYSSLLGNIPGINARGIEWDGTLKLVKGLQFTFGGAYNKATYSDWSTATCPAAYPATVVVCNNTGRQIVGAPVWTVIAGLTYNQPIAGTNLALHGYVNDSYRTRQNLEQNLSPYGWQKAYHLTDIGFGIVREVNGLKTELSVVANNLFDVRYTTSVNDFSNSAPVGYDGIGARRYVGATFRVEF
jgi:iron complex outermembrane receptor protein